MIRYAEILLGYAETLNELGDSKNAVKTVNLIRKRAGVGELDENKIGIRTNSDSASTKNIV